MELISREAVELLIKQHQEAAVGLHWGPLTALGELGHAVGLLDSMNIDVENVERVSAALGFARRAVVTATAA